MKKSLYMRAAIIILLIVVVGKLGDGFIHETYHLLMSEGSVKEVCYLGYNSDYEADAWVSILAKPSQVVDWNEPMAFIVAGIFDFTWLFVLSWFLVVPMFYKRGPNGGLVRREDDDDECPQTQAKAHARLFVIGPFMFSVLFVLLNTLDFLLTQINRRIIASLFPTVQWRELGPLANIFGIDSPATAIVKLFVGPFVIISLAYVMNKIAKTDIRKRVANIVLVGMLVWYLVCVINGVYQIGRLYI